MATWVSHFRVAEYFRKYIKVVDIPFIVGNIGPDCGEPNEDWSKFTPDKTITHWHAEGEKNQIDSEAFFTEYLTNWQSLDKEYFYFYLGYYIHLLTDIEFSTQIVRGKIEVYKEEMMKDKDFIWKIKKDWYDLDHLYLRDHPDFYPFKVFSKIEAFPNKYLRYYSNTAMIKQIQYITQFYKESSTTLNREFIYLTKEENDTFIEISCRHIEEHLIQKGILK